MSTSKVTNTKVIVAVHGIGDQVDYETVQSVARCVAAYYGSYSALPLGRFYSDVSAPEDAAALKPRPQLLGRPSDPKALHGLGFAEVYWADIARGAEARGFVLEEAKKWARTIGARVALRADQGGGALPSREQRKLLSVLDQLIETVFILERLCYLPEKVGLFQFSLQKVLVDFLGDVQIVADFSGYRDRILRQFSSVMNEAAALGADGSPADLYLVAHSEGTVLAFLAVLTALADPKQYPWIYRVKGIMTIGSPIEAHHLLWPELWQQGAGGRDSLVPHPDAPRDIPWNNYLDRGDPIAYSLRATECWLKSQRTESSAEGFLSHLKFKEAVFSRYLLPGKAHTDYWQDDDVFGHFLETVVELKPPATATRSYASAPKDKKWAEVMSWVVPHVLILGLLLTATYFLYRPVASFIVQTDPSRLRVVRDVTGIGVLLLGITAAGRLPRLTPQWRWWSLSAVLLAFSMVTYSSVTCAGSRVRLGEALIPIVRIMPWSVPILPLDSLASGLRFRCTSDDQGKQPDREFAEWNDKVVPATEGVWLLAGLIAAFSAGCASWSAYWGVRVLPSIGVVCALGLVFYLLTDGNAAPTFEMWPVLVGGAVFFYLWWLATLLFDLAFIWHQYIRNSAASVRMAALSNNGYKLTLAERLAEQGVIKGVGQMVKQKVTAGRRGLGD